MNVAVYCASSSRVDPVYADVAEATGALIAARGHTLVYGGGDVGLMGVLARSVHAHGGRVFGVIPEALRAREGIAYEVADELVVTRTMAERKGLMYTRADAFIVLPGGFGTLEEFMEVLTLRLLGYHDKPIALVNTGGFYDPLLAFFDHLADARFTRPGDHALFAVVGTPVEALDHIEAARAAER